MIVTELTWAADSTMQQFGRTHRSNQSSTPLYEIVVSSLGGESRFIGSITSRLQSLGALTKGDRGAAVGDVNGAGEFTGQTFFDRWGRQALQSLCEDLIATTNPKRPPPCIFSESSWNVAESYLNKYIPSTKPSYRDSSIITLIRSYLEYDMKTYRAEALEALASVLILDDEIRQSANMLSSSTIKKSTLTCKKFFNRLGGLHVRIQQNIYGHFKQTYDALIDEAKATQKYHGVAGVLNSYYDHVTYDENAYNVGGGSANEIVHTSDVGGITRMIHLKCDAGMSHAEAMKELKRCTNLAKRYIEEGRIQNTTGDMDGFYWWCPKNNESNKQEVLLIIEKPQLQVRTRGNSEVRGIRILTPHKGSNTYRVGNILGFNTYYNRSEMPTISHVIRGKNMGRLHKIDHKVYGAIVTKLWNRQYELALRKCSICADCRRKDDHPNKKKIDDPNWNCLPTRNVPKTLVCGCILQLWDVYKPSVAALGRRGIPRRGGLRQDAKEEILDPETHENEIASEMSVIRATITSGRDRGKQICGLIVGGKGAPADHVQKVRQSFLNAAPSFKERQALRHQLAAEHRAEQQKRELMHQQKIVEFQQLAAFHNSSDMSGMGGIGVIGGMGGNMGSMGGFMNGSMDYGMSNYASQSKGWHASRMRGQYRWCVSKEPVYYCKSDNIHHCDRNMVPLQHGMMIVGERISRDWWQVEAVGHDGNIVLRFLPYWQDHWQGKTIPTFSDLNPNPVKCDLVDTINGNFQAPYQPRYFTLSDDPPPVNQPAQGFLGVNNGSSSSSNSSSNSNSSNSGIHVMTSNVIDLTSPRNELWDPFLN
jgi:hypothetical protein